MAFGAFQSESATLYGSGKDTSGVPCSIQFAQ